MLDTPRAFQQDIADDDHRFIVGCIHRRAGKTVEALDWLLDHCRNGEEVQPIRDYYLCPFRTQAKGVAFDFLLQMTADDDVQVNKSDLFVQFPNGARLQLLGADGYDKHRGRYAHRVVFDEVAQIPPGAWRQVFRPMLADTKGRALFIGTPLGHGFFKTLFDMQHSSKNWSSYLRTVDDTGIIDAEELAELRAEMTDSEYRQEMLCDWSVGKPGAYFTAEMDSAGDAVEPGELHDPAEVVYTSWSLMPGDSICVCFWQVQRGRPVLIDSQRFLQTSVHQVVKAVRERPYVYDAHVFRAVQRASDAGTVPFRLQTIRHLGLRGPVIPRAEWSDECHLVRQFIPRARFAEERGAEAIEALRQVAATFDEKKRSFTPDPVNDWAYEVAQSIAAFATYYRRGSGLGRRAPIEYPEVTRA